MSHTFPPPRVLVAADFSNLSQRALEYAGEMLALTGGQGVLVHVADALAPPIPPGSTLAPARKRELLDERTCSATWSSTAATRVDGRSASRRESPAPFSPASRWSATVASSSSAPTDAAGSRDCWSGPWPTTSCVTPTARSS